MPIAGAHPGLCRAFRSQDDGASLRRAATAFRGAGFPGGKTRAMDGGDWTLLGRSRRFSAAASSRLQAHVCLLNRGAYGHYP